MIDETILQKLNNQLKAVSDMDDLKKLFKEIGEKGCALVGKRRGYLAFSFRRVEQDRVHYLYDDGISTGESAFVNLHRALKIVKY